MADGASSIAGFRCYAVVACRRVLFLCLGLCERVRVRCGFGDVGHGSDSESNGACIIEGDGGVNVYC